MSEKEISKSTVNSVNCIRFKFVFPLGRNTLFHLKIKGHVTNAIRMKEYSP